MRRRLLFHIRQFGMGGIENALLSWLQVLDRKQFEIGLAVGMPTRELDEIYRARLPADVKVHLLLPEGRVSALMQQRREHRLGPLGRAALGVAMQTWVRAQARRELLARAADYDVVVDFDLMLRKLAGHLPLPMIGVRHFAFWAERNGKARRVGRDLARYDRVAVLNPSMLEQARALYADTVRLTVLPNAFDFAAMRAAATRPVAGLPQDEYVVCVARMNVATKGHDVLLQAWAELCRDPAWTAQLVLVGDGPDMAQVQALAASLGIEARVQFAGLQTNPYPWIVHARALVLPSRAEGQPNVLLEAMALGCVPVATDCPVGPRDLLGSGSGLLVPVDDVAGLAAALRLAVLDAEVAGQCRARAQATVGEYDVAAGNARVAELIEAVLHAHGR